jgi:hypothetical protein
VNKIEEFNKRLKELAGKYQLAECEMEDEKQILRDKITELEEKLNQIEVLCEFDYYVNAYDIMQIIEE